MKNIYTIPVALLAVGKAAPVYANNTTSETRVKTKVEKDADGSYHQETTKTSESTDAKGTTSTSKTKLDVEADADGDSEKNLTTETTVDPEGLLNKTKTVSTDSVITKDGKVEVKHKKKVNGETVVNETTTAK